MHALQEEWKRKQEETEEKALAAQKIREASAQKAAWEEKFKEESLRKEGEKGDIERREEKGVHKNRKILSSMRRPLGMRDEVRDTNDYLNEDLKPSPFKGRMRRGRIDIGIIQI